MSELVTRNGRDILRITLNVICAVEERSKALRSVFLEGDDIQIIDVTEPFYQILNYFDIPRNTAHYSYDILYDAYGEMLDGKLTPDGFIDKLLEDAKSLKRLHAEFGDAVYNELSYEELGELLAADLREEAQG